MRLVAVAHVDEALKAYRFSGRPSRTIAPSASASSSSSTLRSVPGAAASARSPRVRSRSSTRSATSSPMPLNTPGRRGDHLVEKPPSSAIRAASGEHAAVGDQADHTQVDATMHGDDAQRRRHLGVGVVKGLNFRLWRSAVRERVEPRFLPTGSTPIARLAPSWNPSRGEEQPELEGSRP